MKYLKKTNWQRGELNLRRLFQSTALLYTEPSASPKKETSSPEMSNYCLLFKVVPPESTRRRVPTVGMRVSKGRSRSISAVGADRQTAGYPPGIVLCEEVPPTYPLGPGSTNVWGS